ncbi:lysine--tRNA ligase [Patescibacteria group bacterium]
MYWADDFADQIIKSGNHKPYWVDDMKTPSGRVHIGSVRAVVSHYLVYKALIDRGEKATFSYVFEDHDPMDKLPHYVDEKKFGQHVGKPLFTVPSPEPGYKSFGDRWGSEYKEIFNSIGVHPEIILGSDLYFSGRMNDDIRTVLEKADIVRDIYRRMYDQEKPKNWYPFTPVCDECGKLTTTTTGWDGEEITYKCADGQVGKAMGCGHEGKKSPFSKKGYFAGKLPWKVEWPVKWKVIGVTVEGAGKDHMTEGGSHDFGKLICNEVIDYPVPFHFLHEFFLVGGRKMSSSKGTGSSAKEVSQIIPPYLVRFMIVRVKYNRAINFDPQGDIIPDLFDAYDKTAQAYWNKSDEKMARIFELSQLTDDVPEKHFLPRFRDITRIIQDPKLDLKKEMLSIKGGSLTDFEQEVLEERIKYAQIWVENYAPKEDVFRILKSVPKEVEKLSNQQREYLNEVLNMLGKSWDSPDVFQQAMYQKTKDMNIPARDAFQSIYIALAGKTHGPKAAWLLLENKDVVIEKFSNLDSQQENKNDGIEITESENISLHPLFKEKYPSATVGYAYIEGIVVKGIDQDLEKERQEFLESQTGLTTEALGEYEEIQSYRQMYKDMGVKWHSKRPSPEALLRRIATGKGLYSPINTCVDAYNLVVMKNRVSAGAFDADKLQTPVQVKIAEGGETAFYIGDKDEPTTLKEGEVCYFDQEGPYNVDYNYRDALRTAVTLETKNIWINTEGIYDISPKRVLQTLEDTITITQKYCGGKVLEKGIIKAE